MPITRETASANGKLGGRPKGSKSPETLEKERVLAEMRQRIMRSVDPLFNAAKSSAIGNQFLFKIVTETVGKRTVKSKPILVEDREEIRNYIDQLDSSINSGEPFDEENSDVYYFISAKEPNVQAFKELMDRAFGKADAKIDFTSGGEKITGIQINAPVKRKKA